MVEQTGNGHCCVVQAASASQAGSAAEGSFVVFPPFPIMSQEKWMGLECFRFLPPSPNTVIIIIFNYHIEYHWPLPFPSTDWKGDPGRRPDWAVSASSSLPRRKAACLPSPGLDVFACPLPCCLPLSSRGREGGREGSWMNASQGRGLPQG